MGKLSMRKISELLRQRFDLKRSYREIATGLNISVGTVAEYLALARGAGIAWPLPEGITEEGLHQKLFLPGETTKTPKPMPDWEVVYRELRRKGMTLLLLWREYKGIYPNGIGYTQFCVHYSVYVKSVSPVMRQIHKAVDLFCWGIARKNARGHDERYELFKEKIVFETVYLQK